MLTDPILKGKVDTLWDRFWSGGIANPLTAIESVPHGGGTRLRACCRRLVVHAADVLPHLPQAPGGVATPYSPTPAQERAGSSTSQGGQDQRQNFSDCERENTIGVEETDDMTEIFNKKELRERRQFLRSHMTEPEKLIWERIRNKQLHGARFRRQASIGGYVVDFYCPQLRLAIEVDGTSHDRDDN